MGGHYKKETFNNFQNGNRDFDRLNRQNQAFQQKKRRKKKKKSMQEQRSSLILK